MEACNTVERELDKVLLKFTDINDQANAVLRDLINEIETFKRELDQAPADQELTPKQIELLKQSVTKVRDTVHRLATDHREAHSAVSKVGKAIDRNFIADFASTSREDVFNGAEKTQLLNQVICQHFYRQGMLDIAEELASETGIKTDDSKKEPFTELNKILDCLKQRNLEPALEWAKNHREALLAQNSSLEFKLHRLQFIRLVQQGPSSQAEAVMYARKNLTQFVSRHEKEVQSLMGTLLYLPNGIQSSPYSHLLDPNLWLDIHDVFTKEACTLLGLSVDSPLSVCVNAGCTALPALLNIKQVMQQRQVTNIWNGKDELPIEIDLGKQSRYHSVFACPILRQQSTENNPPMKLVCGHVISRDALNKLTNSNKNQFVSRLKCPYCPVEQNPEDARLIYF
ncbi:E3 ubiquitin-protein ligase RMND5A isoform X1 [Microplitis mediator]|uniref:E3 ubiquitin-protein ligase RMND5A isoform X1 n=1 Tax=Microplitis demolitor TaxID=69319 RepID=UPI0004CDCC83|nr:E3 ubiquitin-protein ligase RMND5A isoform X1 [Microplitis demolitor]XP_057332987.1 E3 ubiquitin-protein ligase RMND5A isoform X1 [Microplitis mediator]